MDITVTVNGQSYAETVEPRMLLSDFLRQQLALTGTHVGCEQGVCGACTVLLDGLPVRSCLMFAVQADGREVETVEHLAAPDGKLSPLQQAFWEEHGLQCGFCTPGILMELEALSRRTTDPDQVGEADIKEALSGNLCRCTGYQNIVKAALRAVKEGAAR